ncbi:MAG: DNA internalization-related competence protein ComEC/Rec2 [Clostridiales bacterium]|nr:DNA internalization-related competence protein ComEC/Rec2 [Clostridiales bacterium]
MRIRIGQVFEEVLGEKDGSVLKAMLLGEKKDLDKDIKKLYQQASISHVLCISGLHITFLGMGLYRLLKRIMLPQWCRMSFCILLMLLYGRMTGMGNSAMRAIFMFSLSLFAGVVGRSYDMLTALAVSMVLILVENPLYIQQSGFLLSFGAVMGMGVVTPVLYTKENRIGTDRKSLQFADRIRSRALSGLAGGLGVFLATLPVLLQNFYEVAPYSLLLNLLVLPLSTILLPAGLLIPVLYAVYPPLANIPGAVCRLILLLFERGCRLSLTLPGSRFTVGHVESWQVILYYMILTVLVITGNCYRKRFPGRMRAIFVLGAVFVLTAPTWQGGIRVTMLDVGQGDCFLIQSGRTEILVDGGSSSEKDVGRKRILPVLKYYGIRELDYILISHTDEDHVNGIKELLAEGEIRCKMLALPRTADWEAVLPQNRKPPMCCLLQSGDKIKEKGFVITVLHPLPDEAMQDANSTSMVILLQGEGSSMLFNGDLPGEQEALFLEDGLLLKELEKDRTEGKAGNVILKAGHHGSNGSTTEELLDALKPVLTIVSCGKNNIYGHPGEDFLKRVSDNGSRVLVTAWDGTCEFVLKKGSVEVKTGQSRSGIDL